MAWYNASWAYRKKIVIAHTDDGAQTNYQMKLKIGESSGATGEDVDCNSHCASDFDDLRFTKSDGTTLLDYWIESVSGTTPNQLVTIWIEIDSIAGHPNDTIIYMYYGNSGASAASSITSTFPFADDFNDASIDGTKWYHWLANGSTTEASGSLQVTGHASYEAYGGKTTFQLNYAYRGRVYTTVEGTSDLCLFGFDDRANDGSYQGTGTDAAYFKVSAINNKKYFCAREGTSTSTERADDITSYTILEIQRDSVLGVKFLINDILKETISTNIPQDDAAVCVYNDNPSATIYWDWVCVRKFITHEPTWGSFGVEYPSSSTFTSVLKILPILYTTLYLNRFFSLSSIITTFLIKLYGKRLITTIGEISSSIFKSKSSFRIFKTPIVLHHMISRFFERFLSTAVSEVVSIIKQWCRPIIIDSVISLFISPFSKVLKLSHKFISNISVDLVSDRLIEIFRVFISNVSLVSSEILIEFGHFRKFIAYIGETSLILRYSVYNRLIQTYEGLYSKFIRTFFIIEEFISSSELSVVFSRIIINLRLLKGSFGVFVLGFSRVSNFVRYALSQIGLIVNTSKSKVSQRSINTIFSLYSTLLRNIQSIRGFNTSQKISLLHEEVLQYFREIFALIGIKVSQGPKGFGKRPKTSMSLISTLARFFDIAGKREIKFIRSYKNIDIYATSYKDYE